MAAADRVRGCRRVEGKVCFTECFQTCGNYIVFDGSDYSRWHLIEENS